MIRIYLDWNIFKYLKEPEKLKEKTAEVLQLKSLLDKYENYITLCYSPAHVRDLMNKNLSNFNDDRVQSDFALIDSLTTNYLSYSEGNMRLLVGFSKNALLEDKFFYETYLFYENTLKDINIHELFSKETQYFFKDLDIKEDNTTFSSLFNDLVNNLKINKIDLSTIPLYQKFFYEYLRKEDSKIFVNDACNFVISLLANHSVWKNLR
jgi:hypothetical protein